MQFPFQQVRSVYCVYGQHLFHRFKRSSLAAELSTDLKRLIFFSDRKLTFIWRNIGVKIWLTPGFFLIINQIGSLLWLFMAGFLFKCAQCIKYVFVAIVIRVVLILLLSFTCRSLVVTVGSQMWPSINIAAAEAFMCCALFTLFGLLCMYWINFTLIESSSGFVRIQTVLVCALVRARWRFVSFFCFTPQSDMRVSVRAHMWVCVCVVISKGSGNQGNLETAVTSAHQQWLRWKQQWEQIKAFGGFL